MVNEFVQVITRAQRGSAWWGRAEQDEAGRKRNAKSLVKLQSQGIMTQQALCSSNQGSCCVRCKTMSPLA